MVEESIAVCIYCGCRVCRGDNCCQECFDSLVLPDCAIGERLGNLELFAELINQLLKKAGIGTSQ